MGMIKVVIPVYNTEPYLRRCIDSVLVQTEKDYFIVLVDDGSPDNCGKICDEYAAKHENIYVIHQTNQGISTARNAGIKFISEFDYLTFIDSDDWVHPRYLEVLLCAAQCTGCAMSVCDYQEVELLPNQLNNIDFTPIILTPEECYCTKQICATVTWGKLYRKEVFQNVHFPIGKLYEDTFTTWKLIFSLDKIAIVPTALYYYFYNPNGITKRKWNPQNMDLLDALDEQIDYFKKNNYELAQQKAIEKYHFFINFYISAVKKTEYKDVYLKKLLLLKEKSYCSLTSP